MHCSSKKVNMTTVVLFKKLAPDSKSYAYQMLIGNNYADRRQYVSQQSNRYMLEICRNFVCSLREHLICYTMIYNMHLNRCMQWTETKHVILIKHWRDGLVCFHSCTTSPFYTGNFSFGSLQYLPRIPEVHITFFPQIFFCHTNRCVIPFVHFSSNLNSRFFFFLYFTHFLAPSAHTHTHTKTRTHTWTSLCTTRMHSNFFCICRSNTERNWASPSLKPSIAG